MTPKQWKAILKKAKQLQKEEEAINRTLNQLCQAVSPSSFSIHLGKGPVYGFLEAVRDIEGDLAYDNITYYLYEVPAVAERHGKCEVRDKEGNVYDANNLGSYVKFLVADQEPNH